MMVQIPLFVPAPCVAANGPVITIGSAGGATTDRSQTITGFFADTLCAAPTGTAVEINDDGVKVGSATVAADGTWTADVLLSELGTNILVATAQNRAEIVATSAPVTFTLNTVQSPPSGGRSTFEKVHMIEPSYSETVSAAGGSDTFVFRPHPGHVVVEGFDLNGIGKDRLSFASQSFSTLADVLHHTTMAGGDAVIHLSPRDSVTLTGISKTQLRADPSAFQFQSH